MSEEDKITYHKWLPGDPSINAKLIENSKGFNIEITVQGATDAEMATRLIKETYAKLKSEFPSA